jgi:hypothetical protein
MINITKGSSSYLSLVEAQLEFAIPHVQCSRPSRDDRLDCILVHISFLCSNCIVMALLDSHYVHDGFQPPLRSPL